MSKMETLEPRLQWFVKRMRRKLRLKKNQAKKDWRELRMLENFEAIGQELGELSKAVMIFPGDKQAIIDECADVANRAMMFADQINKRGLV